VGRPDKSERGATIVVQLGPGSLGTRWIPSARRGAQPDGRRRRVVEQFAENEPGGVTLVAAHPCPLQRVEDRRHISIAHDGPPTVRRERRRSTMLAQGVI
jgi:hypothetical protein